MLPANHQQQTMSSREIATLTGKQHKHVVRDIRSMLEQLEIDSAQFWAQYKDSSGKLNTEYNLPRRECEILITGYDVKRRAAVIDRWHALETGQAEPAAKLDYRPEAAKIKSLIDEGVLTKQDAYKWATGADISANGKKPKESQEDIEAGINFCVERLQLLLDDHPDMTVREVEAFHAQNKDFFGGYTRDKYLRPAMEEAKELLRDIMEDCIDQSKWSIRCDDAKKLLEGE